MSVGGDGTVFNFSNLTNADLSGGSFFRSGFAYATMTNANLSGAKLRGAVIPGADLSGANLSGADLSDALLGPSDWYSTRHNRPLMASNLTNANLSGAMLTNADLTNVNFTGAQLNNANLTGAHDDRRQPDRCGHARRQLPGIRRARDRRCHHVPHAGLFRGHRRPRLLPGRPAQVQP